MRYAIAFVFLMTVLAAVPQQAVSATPALRDEGPGAPPSAAPDPKDPPASPAPSPSGNVPSKSRPATSMFNGTGLNPPAQAPAMAAAGAGQQPAATSGSGPDLFYWDNGSYQNVDKSICVVNNLPSITFYIQYYLCASKCLGGFLANPYRWSFWLYHGSTLIWSNTGNVRTSTVWINFPVTLATPLQSGAYHAELKLEKRVFISTWQTVFDTTTGTVNFPDPPAPVAQAGAPEIRLEVVAQTSELKYQLRGWQTNGNAALAGQWNLYNSDNLGTEVGPPLSVTWAPPGTHYLVPPILDLGQWYMLKYGNYSACYSWNETRRLIYIKK